MKIRIGFGLGTRSFTNRPETFDPFVDALEELGFDSLWLSERVSGEAPDPVVGMAYAAGRTTRLKFGTSVMVLPGRNPVLVAKELASLDRLSNGRLLPAFGLGAVDPREQQAFAVERGERARLFDEALPLIRRLWEEEVIDHHGEHYSFEGVSVLPQPTQKPLDVWLGGQAPSELRRVGRLGDGWLPSFCDADDVAEGRVLVEAEAERVGRTIDPEHFGALVAYRNGPLPDEVLAFVGRRRPEKDPADLLPEGMGALRARLEQLVEVGASKFVVLRLGEPDDWGDELAEVAAQVLPMEN